ncbi:MAG: LysM peptidoglycan-binding domain-containing protein [Planctomycetaceae bacterium]
MPNDQKVGFALGLLLLGIVAAFFFRHPPLEKTDVPTLESSADVDAQISEKDVTPYLSGIEAEQDDVSGPTPAGENHLASGDANSRSRREPPRWEVPDFLKRNTSSNGNRISNPEKVAPNPIPLVSESTTNTKLSTSTKSRTLKYIPEHNNAWETVPPIPIPDETDSPAKSPFPADSSRATAPETLKTHVVQSGETLSGIASKHLGSSARFEEIYEANRDLLKNPNDLRVGMKLKIPPRRRAADVETLPADGPSASAASTRSTAPTTAAVRKPFTRAAIRTPDGHPSKADTKTPPTTTDESNSQEANTDNANEPAASRPVAPRGRFAPARRSPYQPKPDASQTSIESMPTAKPMDIVKQSAAGRKPAKKRLTQTPPNDLPLDVQIQTDAETATR